MKNIILCDKSVRVDEHDNFICITDLWKSSGEQNKHKPKYFLDNEKTIEFIDILKVKGGIPPLRTINDGHASGTWVHKLLAYEYAGWVDPQFKYSTLTVLDEFFTGTLNTKNTKNTNEPMHELQDYTRRMINHQKEGTFHGKGLSMIKKKKHALIEEGENLLNHCQISIF